MKVSSLFSLISISCAAVLLVTGCIKNEPIGGPSTVSTDVSKDYTMPASGFVFPLSVAGLERGETKQYDRKGEDVSVGYNLMKPPIKITTYVYKTPLNSPEATLEKHFEFCKSEVTRYHTSFKLESEGSIKVPIGNSTQSGLRAVYSYSEELFGKTQDVYSEVYLFTNNGWFVLYRITYAKPERASCEMIVKNYLKELKWP